MRPSREIPWILMVEEGDTEEDVARWIESHCVTTDLTIMPPGSINVDQWPIVPKPGYVIVTNAPPDAGTVRFSGFLVRHDEMADKMVEEWFEPIKHETIIDAIVNMLTRGRRKHGI